MIYQGGMKKLSRLRSIFGYKTFIVIALSVLSTWACIKTEFTADFPLTLMATAVIFPIVFSIGGAYKRRENALVHYGSLKAHGRAIYFVSRDWLADTTPEVQARFREELTRLMDACRTLFTHDQDEVEKYETDVYDSFSRLSRLIKTDLRENGLPSGEVSRTNQYLSKMFTAFEGIKHIFQYRTPRTLRAFSDIFIVILPPLYGPFFAAEAAGYSSPILAFVLPVLFAFILTSLDNIQAHLENPFDQIGHDDITISVEKFATRLD